jgi:hypothetical protein
MSRSLQPTARPIRSTAAVVKSAALFAAMLAAAGCTPSKSSELATCEKETLRFYSDTTGDDFMIACMDAKGYRFDVEPADCDGQSRMARQQACYVPVGWLAEFLDGLNRPSKPSSAAALRDQQTPRQPK